MPYFLLSIITVYLIINLYVTRKINQAEYIKEERRSLHKKLIWIIPFLGPYMIKSYWKTAKKEPIKIITKEDRKTERGGFYESGSGFSGV